MLKGKKGLIMGLANANSIAWGISKVLSDMGAEMIFSYQHEIFRKKIEKLAAEVNCTHIFECDVSVNGHTERLFDKIGETYSKIDFVVHSLAFIKKEELSGSYLKTNKDNFMSGMHISSFSFTEVCREAAPLLNDNASLLTMTYLGAERFIPNYNAMGVIKASLESSVRYLAHDLGAQGHRVNAISAGPIKTLAASGGIADFSKFLEISDKVSPLGNVTQEDVGHLAAFLISDMSKKITGGVHYVDGGYNFMGMTLPLDNAEA